MDDPLVISAIAFIVVAGITLGSTLLLGGNDGGQADRTSTLAKESPSHSQSGFRERTLPRLALTMLPQDEGEKTKLQARMYHAGMYSAGELNTFLAVKLALIIIPSVLGLIAGLLNPDNLIYSLLFGLGFATFGVIGSGRYLDNKKDHRQTMMKRGLPDALDLIVICLEAGLTLEGAFRRVTTDLMSAHPELAMELLIVQRDTEMGRPSGEALRNFSARCGLDDVRTLANVVIQAERFGASIVSTLKVHADGLRQKRQREAEEKARMAGTKILFPTIIFIFPGLFLVILGPAMISILEAFRNL